MSENQLDNHIKCRQRNGINTLRSLLRKCIVQLLAFIEAGKINYVSPFNFLLKPCRIDFIQQQRYSNKTGGEVKQKWDIDKGLIQTPTNPGLKTAVCFPAWEDGVNWYCSIATRNAVPSY